MTQGLDGRSDVTGDIEFSDYILTRARVRLRLPFLLRVFRNRFPGGVSGSKSGRMCSAKNDPSSISRTEHSSNSDGAARRPIHVAMNANTLWTAKQRASPTGTNSKSPFSRTAAAGAIRGRPNVAKEGKMSRPRSLLDIRSSTASSSRHCSGWHPLRPCRKCRMPDTVRIHRRSDR